MDLAYCVRELSTNGVAVQGLVADIDDDQAHWRPSPDAWSMVEVVSHLADEERYDFRARVQHLLSGATGTWTPISPGEWVTERAYNQRGLGESVADYAREREASLKWLQGLGDVDWGISYSYSPLTGVSAGDLLVSWAVHDLLHLRQLLELKWTYGQLRFAPYRTRYAGEW